jgi:glycine C-acetyltransferase
MASVRFICGTQTIHRELEERLSAFLGTEDAILFGSCFDANGGVFEALLDERTRSSPTRSTTPRSSTASALCKAQRLRYANRDMAELEQRCVESPDARYRLIVTDGVFSMDGYLAPLTRSATWPTSTTRW